MLFTPRDDEDLVRLVNSIGEKEWRRVAESMAQRFTPRQCRERWKNYLDPRLQHSPWSREDDIRLMDEYRRIGNQWISLAGIFPGRTGNSVRNRCNMLLRRKRMSLTGDPLWPFPSIQDDTPDVSNIFAVREPGTGVYAHEAENIVSIFFSGVAPENDAT
jgi:hypothetical protein